MIKVTGLHKVYNKNRRNEVNALNGVSLELGDTGLCAIYGKSGSGKTTLMNALGGLDSFDGGRIETDGNIYDRYVDDKFRIENIGYIFQNYLLDGQVNVYENVARGLRTIGVRDEEIIFRRVMTALSNVGMEKYYRRSVDTLSGGQQQRVAIARAMVKGARIILADEPTGNLDELNTKTVMDILKEMSKTCLVILVTHEQNLIEQYADKVIEIVDGNIVLTEDREAIGRHFTDKTKIFLGGMEKREVESGNVTLEVYGGTSPLRLRLVCNNGKYYLSSQEGQIRWVDDKSEVQFIEKSKEEYFAQEQEKTAASLDILDRIEPTSCGKVFMFRECFADGIKSVVGWKRKKRFALAVLLLAFSVALIFLLSIFGGTHRDFQLAGADVDPYCVTVDCGSAEEEEQLLALADEYGKFYQYKASYGTGIQLSFELSGFESLQENGYVQRFDFFDKSLAEGKKFLAGGFNSDVRHIYITSALADELLDEYENSLMLEGLGYDNILKSNVTYTGENNQNTMELNIAGIVEGERPYVFIDDGIYYEDFFVNRYNVALDKLWGQSAADGEVLVNRDEYPSWNDGEVTLWIGNKEFKVRLYDGERDSESRYLINSKEMRSLPFEYESYGTVSLVIYAQSADALAEKIRTEYPGTYVTSKAIIIAEEKAEAQEMMIQEGITILAISVLLFAGMYLLMYASMVSRIKEIGVYRAIGVLKSNIMLKFFYESLALILCSVGAAFLLLGLPFAILSPLGKLIPGLFLPWWMYLPAFAAVVVLLLGICILPVTLFLRKSPVSILSKYDL